MKSRIEYLLKHNWLIQKTYKFIFSGLMKLLGLFIKMDNKTVLFTGHGGGYNDSPRFIYEKIVDDNRFSDFNLVWGLSKNKIDKNVKKYVKIDSFKYFVISLKAKYWIASVNIERGLKYKKKKTIYLNTWHGIPIKTVGNQTDFKHKFDFSNIDYFVVSSEYEKKIYIEAFNIDPKSFIETGLPRNEMLYKKNAINKNEVKEKLKISKNKKIILYAPTWRDSENLGKNYNIKIPMNLEIWKKKLSKDFVILMRAHPYTTQVLNVNFDEFLIDVSNYQSINELIIISDILISDYSAILFDYSIVNKPMFCFAYDYEEYKKKRGLNLSLENEFPGGIINNENELISKIKSVNKQKLMNDIKKFRQKYLEYGKDSVNQCINILFKEL